MRRIPVRFLLAAIGAVMVSPLAAAAQDRVTPPVDFFGHEIGADYMLFNYERLHEYWVRLADESDRMVLDTIGMTEEGRPQIQAIITSPENHQNIDRYRDISARMAKAAGVSRDEALWRALLRRDLRRWDRVSSDRDPHAFRAAYPNISSKCM